MGWLPPHPPPPHAVFTAEGVVTRDMADRLRKAFAESIEANFGKPMVLVGDFCHQSLAKHQQPKPYACKSCGAPVQSHEPACTYCTTERPPEHFDLVETTALQDPSRIFVKVLRPPEKP